MRRAFRAFTFVLLGLTLWMAYTNVYSAMPPAGPVAQSVAGCGASCKMLDIHGDRGMLSTEVVYTVDKVGQVVVTCRRPWVAFGDWVCTGQKL